MLGDKQEQSVEGGSVAIQAGRDVVVTGLTVADVKEVCLLVFRENFPRLREEARLAAEQYALGFAATLEARLVADAASINLGKCAEPDVQAAINDAVQACARKGQAAHPDLLSKLISERVAVTSDDYKDLVLCEAVKVVPKLTGPQIALLSFHHFVASVRVQNLPSIELLEPWGQTALRFSTPGFNLSDSQKRHIEYAGAWSINNIVGGDIYEMLRAGDFKYFGFTETEAFKSAIASKAPTFGVLLDQFGNDRLLGVNLTSVGQAIALANISSYLGKLDYSIWLK